MCAYVHIHSNLRIISSCVHVCFIMRRRPKFFVVVAAATLPAVAAATVQKINRCALCVSMQPKLWSLIYYITSILYIVCIAVRCIHTCALYVCFWLAVTPVKIPHKNICTVKIVPFSNQQLEYCCHTSQIYFKEDKLARNFVLSRALTNTVMFEPFLKITIDSHEISCSKDIFYWVQPRRKQIDWH